LSVLVATILPPLHLVRASVVTLCITNWHVAFRSCQVTSMSRVTFSLLFNSFQRFGACCMRTVMCINCLCSISIFSSNLVWPDLIGTLSFTSSSSLVLILLCCFSVILGCCVYNFSVVLCQCSSY
jgi:hypothetical protein